jgi:transcriptional regulator with XRE-family HTH domain
LTLSRIRGQYVDVADNTREVIAAEVRAEMARQQKLQSALGELLGLPQQSISRRLRGEIPFRAEELVRVADWLGVPVSQFLPASERVA